MPALDDWINSADAQLPKPPVAGDLGPRLRGLFDAHAAAVDAFSPGPIEDAVRAARPAIGTLGDSIIAAVEAFLAGRHARAYAEFVAGVTAVEPFLRTLTSPVDPVRLLPTYRIRVSAVPRRFERAELFHIPFDQRRLVSSQRFSVAGLPCLYLGHSTYVCWEEMRRPPFSTVYVAQLRFRDGVPVRILELSSVPAFHANILREIRAGRGLAGRLEQMLTALTVIWPLHAACAVRVFDPEKPFKPEYIVPQLLLQWLTEATDWHGIRYFSSHVGSPRGLYVGANLVLPARQMAPRGYCAQLSAMFDVTPVWNWEVALAAPPAQVPSRVTGEIEPAAGAFVDYVNTSFYEMESILSGQDAVPI